MRRSRSVWSDEVVRREGGSDRSDALARSPASRRLKRTRPWLRVLAVAALASCVAPCEAARAAFDVFAPGARAAALAFRTGPGPIRLPEGPAESDRAGTFDGSPGAPDAGSTGGTWALELSGCELFGLPEARAWRASLERCGSVSLSLEAGGFGGPLYEEHVLAAGIGVAADGRGHLGLRVRGLGLSAAGLEDRWSCAVDAGVAAMLLNRILVSCGWTNLGGSSIGGSPIAQTATACGSLVVDRFVGVASIIVESDLEPSSSLGIEFRMAPALVLRAGVGREPALFAAGIGLTVPPGIPTLAGCAVDVAWQWNPELGVNTFASISFRH